MEFGAIKETSSRAITDWEDDEDYEDIPEK